MKELETTKVGETSKEEQESRLKWYGHVLRREDEYVGKRVMVMKVAGKRRRGIPKRRWLDNIRNDLSGRGLSGEEAQDRIWWLYMMIIQYCTQHRCKHTVELWFILEAEWCRTCKIWHYNKVYRLGSFYVFLTHLVWINFPHPSVSQPQELLHRFLQWKLVSWEVIYMCPNIFHVQLRIRKMQIKQQCVFHLYCGITCLVMFLVQLCRHVPISTTLFNAGWPTHSWWRDVWKWYHMCTNRLHPTKKITQILMCPTRNSPFDYILQNWFKRTHTVRKWRKPQQTSSETVQTKYDTTTSPVEATFYNHYFYFVLT